MTDVLGGDARPPDVLPPGAQPTGALRLPGMQPTGVLRPPVARRTPSPPRILPGISEDIAGDDEIRVMADQWVVCFSDPIRGWIEGRLQHSPSSRWTSLRDMDNDILAGDYLAADVQIEVGMRFILDDFDVHVLSCLQEVQREEIEVIDLTTTHEATREAPAAIAVSRPSVHATSSTRHVGGRFWVLADSEDEEDDDGDPDGRSPVNYSLTPSHVVVEAFSPGHSQEEVATLVPGDAPGRIELCSEERVDRRTIHRRTAATVIRPWKGPIPKVIFRATTLIRSWSLLTPMEAREHLVTGSIRWEMVARDIFNRFGWRSCNRIDN
ncbi:uncharacterized protein LOC125523786 [Triticum urartu]|uniref:uncharacterized protein LOC125523786 n=1 Tax=Triticum urartu TaxID=4572 RepID=UPI002043399F|nr:uncharacterized protein LOC125523786 [Triticum urartu]